jgi:alpha-beta hydrolase superfamily lysophospholipase
MADSISTGYFTNRDGFSFFTRRTHPARPKAHLVVVHGLGEHSGRYEPFIEHFTSHGYAVSAFDLRGHGSSEGKRGDVRDFSQWVDDARAMLWEFRRTLAGGLPTILVGHSLGGLIALNYLAGHDDVDGAVISAPPLGRLPVPAWKTWLGMKFAGVLPKLQVGAEIRPEHLSRDPEIVRAYKSDRLVLKRVTLRAGQALVTNSAEAMPLAYRIKLPLLMLHGAGDRICDPEATKRFFNDVPASIKNLRLYEGAFHEPFTDVIRERVFQDVEDWIGTMVVLREMDFAAPGRHVDRYSDQVHHES